MNWQYVMIHHSLTKDGAVVDWNAIRRYHIEVQGWQDIGYHFGLEKVRDIYQVQVGRSLNLPGAHCKQNNMNSLAIGVCVVGNYDLVSPCPDQLTFLARAIIVPYLRKYDIPIKNVVTHHDYTPYKTCPGKLFSMDILRQICTEML